MPDAIRGWFEGLPNAASSPEFISALFGAIVGGSIALLASWLQIRGARSQRRQDNRVDAYVAWMIWAERLHEGVNATYDTRDARVWNAGPVETRAMAFASAPVRQALSRVATLRDQHWWYSDSEACTHTSELVWEIRVAMGREIGGERPKPLDWSLARVNRRVKDLVDAMPGGPPPPD